MDQTSLFSLSAFLVALAKIPVSESVPLTNGEILQAIGPTILNLRQQGGNQKFWRIYDESLDYLLDNYQTRVRSKTIFPSQTPEEASPKANNEEENLSVSADGVEASFQQLDQIFTGKPDQNAKQSYQGFRQSPLKIENKDHYNWAIYLCTKALS